MLSKRFSRDIELKWQEKWEKEGTNNFDESDTTKPIFSIDTPPPFTSGELHMGHVLSYSFFDFIARYKRMQGFNVYYPQGWDTQGFPTEVKVEKKFGRLPREDFRQKCVEWTEEMIKRMKSQMIAIGLSPDWRYEYRTMDPEYHKKVQLSLVKMYSDKLVYRDKYPVYWCGRCGSAVAKAELDDVEKEGVMVWLKFSLPAGEDVLIATTRPEMLPACQAVLYNPEDERYNTLKGEIITPLGKKVPLIADKDVDKDFGSGLVMVCTFGDKMDVVWMHRYHLPMQQIIDERGKMVNTEILDGLKVTEARKKILEILKDKVAKKKDLVHTVKVHDRCKTAVELIPSMQWFADIRSPSNDIKALARRIKWVPEFGINYLLDWVDGAEWDWVISRQRIFGTPLPFYVCECGNTAVAEELPFYPEKAPEKLCSCGKKMKPETSVCDCWVDSSITPLIISGWPDDKKMERFYPVSLRPQGVEIVRTWAFYTIYRSGYALTSLPPFETILLNGNVLAPDGKKMSKSLGNVISPADLLKQYPADAIRQWAAMSGAMAKDRPFSYEDIKYAKSFLNKLWNSARFIENLGKAEKPETLRKVDQWILARLSQVIEHVTEAMENYEFHHAIGEIQRFYWNEFCDHYLEYVKYRVYGDVDKDAALYTLNHVLSTVLHLLAPFTPHITEEIHSILYAKEDADSIHKEHWPMKEEYSKEIITEVSKLIELVSKVRQIKSSKRLSQAAEVEKATLYGELEEELKEELKQICKIKELELKEGTLDITF